MPDEPKPNLFSGGFLSTAYSLLKDFGLPTVLLGLLVWMIKDSTVAVYNDVLLPVAKKHIDFLQVQTEVSEQNAAAQKQTAEAIEDIANQKDDSIKVLEEIVEQQKALHKDIRAVIGAPPK